MNLTPEQVKAFADTMEPEELRAHAERFIFLAANCIQETWDGKCLHYDLRLPLFYNFSPVQTVDYLLGKLGENPTVEDALKEQKLFGRK
jgi:hypothetical protein